MNLGRLHRYAKISEAMDYVLLGWIPLPSLRGTHHESYAVHMAWLCDCEAIEPKKKAPLARGLIGLTEDQLPK